MYTHDEGQVSVFVNDKGDNPKRPDYNGKGKFRGEMFEISLWKTTSKDGKDYLSGKLQEPYNGGESSPRSKFDVPEVKQDDDLPF